MAKRKVTKATEGDTLKVGGQEFDIGPDVYVVTEDDGSQRLVHKNALEGFE